MLGKILCLAAVGLVGGSVAADPVLADRSWIESLSDPLPGRFPSIEPFSATYSFGWIDIEAASAKVRVDRVDSDIEVRVEGATSGFVRALWQLDATHRAVIHGESLLPKSVDQTEKFRNRKIVTQVRFEPGELKRQRQAIPGDEAKWKRLVAPNVFDILGTGLWLRSQNLENGRTYRLVCYPGEAPYLVEFQVEGREAVPVMNQMQDAIACSFRIQKIEVDEKRLQGLMPHQKFRQGRLWLSDDDRRIPLRAEADVFIGYVYGELLEINFEAPAK